MRCSSAIQLKNNQELFRDSLERDSGADIRSRRKGEYFPDESIDVKVNQRRESDAQIAKGRRNLVLHALLFLSLERSKWTCLVNSGDVLLRLGS